MILKDQKIFLGEKEFTTDSSALALDAGVEPQDDTRFGGSTRIYEGGLLTFGWNLQGFWKGGAGDVDDVLYGKLGVNGVPVSVLAQGAAAGDRAYFLQALEAEYQFLGEIGGSHKFTVGGQATGRLVRGQTLHNAAVTSSGNGTAVNVGAVAAGQTLYAALHVYVDNGTTLDVILQSDTSGFPSPTTRLTFTQATGVTSQYLTLAGPITDDWWRSNHTVVGTGWSYALVIGIH